MLIRCDLPAAITKICNQTVINGEVTDCQRITIGISGTGKQVTGSNNERGIFCGDRQ